MFYKLSITYSILYIYISYVIYYNDVLNTQRGSLGVLTFPCLTRDITDVTRI